MPSSKALLEDLQYVYLQMRKSRKKMIYWDPALSPKEQAQKMMVPYKDR